MSKNAGHLAVLLIAGLCGGARAFVSSEKPVSTDQAVPVEQARVGRQLQSTTASTFVELQNALSAGSATDIVLTSGTYAVSSTLQIAEDVTIRGPSSGAPAVLDGGDARRVMIISSGTVLLVGLHFTNGNGDDGEGGGAILINGGTVTIQSAGVYNSTDRGGGMIGGGLHVTAGTATIEGSIFRYNTAAGDSNGGGMAVSGGTVTIQGVSIHDNFATSWCSGCGGTLGGGRLAINGGAVTIRESSIYSNSASWNPAFDGRGANGYVRHVNVNVCDTDTSGWYVGNDAVLSCIRPPPLPPSASPPPGLPPYVKEASIPFGPAGEHRLVCRYEIDPNGNFNTATTGCSFEMSQDGS